MKSRNVKESLRKKVTVDTSEIKANVKAFLENRKNVNKLLDVLAQLENGEDAQVIAAVRGLHKVFTTIIQLKEMTSPRPVKDVDEANLTPDEKYKIWLQETYKDFITRLLSLMHHQSPNVQELCLCSLMKLVAEEGAQPIVKPTSTNSNFPTALYQNILTSLLSPDHVMGELIARAQEFMEYDDVRMATMSYLLSVMKRNSGQLPENHLKNIFSLLRILSMPDDSPDRQPSCFVTSSTDGSAVKDLKSQRRQFGNVWIEFLKNKVLNLSEKNKLSVNQYKRVLVILHDKVMPHMTTPVSLCDFLTHAYNIGGAISLLALNGLFVLIQKHHLNYPEFYSKLYALLDENVLHVKYRARFIYLTDLFLTSSHLPVYLVAAFIKRLSRLSLSAPTDSLLFVLPLIYNLMVRHPHTQKLIHHAGDVTDCESDPFDPDERDPIKCEALNSSLWELKSLQMHYHPDVANMARKMNKNLPDREYDISERLETKYDQLVTDEFNKPMDKVHTAFTPVNGLFSSQGDRSDQFWSME